MTETTQANYEAAFNELLTLNRLFANYDSPSLPRLNPQLFTVVRTEKSYSDVVIIGTRSGFHYFSQRTSVSGPTGLLTATYTPFVRVIPKERTVTDWEPINAI